MPSILPGESEPPALQRSISEHKRKEKEARVFDSAVNDVCKVYWKNSMFDGFPVETIPVECQESTQMRFGSYDRVKDFLKSPLRDLGEYPDIMAEMKMMLKHVDRHTNELVFMKCEDRSRCKEWESKKLYSFLSRHNMSLFAPVPSEEYKGHYKTFLEVCATGSNQLPDGDKGQPTAEERIWVNVNCVHPSVSRVKQVKLVI